MALIQAMLVKCTCRSTTFHVRNKQLLCHPQSWVTMKLYNYKLWEREWVEILTTTSKDLSFLGQRGIQLWNTTINCSQYVAVWSSPMNYLKFVVIWCFDTWLLSYNSVDCKPLISGNWDLRSHWEKFISISLSLWPMISCSTSIVHLSSLSVHPWVGMIKSLPVPNCLILRTSLMDSVAI